MAQGYSLDAAGMANAATRVENVKSELDAQLNSLKNKLEPLEHAWRGTAAVAFRKLLEEWGTETRNVNAALGGIAEVLKSQAKGYVQQEEAVESRMSHIMAGLDDDPRV